MFKLQKTFCGKRKQNKWVRRKKDKIDKWISSEYGEKEEELFEKILKRIEELKKE